MSSRIKVLQLQTRYNVNKSDLAEQIIKSLPRDKFEVTSVYLKGLPSDSSMLSCADHVEYFDLNSKDCKGGRSKPLGLLRKLCDKSQFDIVVAHRFKPIHMMLKLNKEYSFKKLVGLVHGIGDYDRVYRKFEIWRSLRPNCTVVAVSNPVKTYLLKSRAGFNRNNTICINNAIDVAEARNTIFDRALSRQKLCVSEDKFVIGTIGRLVPVKDQKTLISSFIHLAKKYPNIELVIIGDGRLRDEFLETSKVSGFSDRIFLAGAIEDAYRLVSAYDLFVLPSLSEGLPLALLEAMAARLPIVASNIPQIAGVLPNQSDLFDAGSVSGLTQKMEKYVLMDSCSRDDIGVSNLTHVEENHSIEQFRESYFKLLSGNLSG